MATTCKCHGLRHEECCEEIAALHERVTELEGHRKTWRSIAARALSSLRSFDPKLAEHIESGAPEGT